MPVALLKLCPLCRKPKPCAKHGTTPIHEFSRPNAHQRGYTRRWNEYTHIFLQEHPLCAMCEKQDIIEAADVVDHIIPVHGPNDPNFWEPRNHQALSYACHALKTRDDIKRGLTRNNDGGLITKGLRRC